MINCAAYSSWSQNQGVEHSASKSKNSAAGGPSHVKAYRKAHFTTTIGIEQSRGQMSNTCR
jgi:hypothetical protein